jgi:hypothetical protein
MRLCAPILAALALATGCSKPQTAAPVKKPVATSKSAPAEAVKSNNSAEYVSVFEDLSPQAGKDPFFPMSHRRDPVAPTVTTPSPVHVAPTLILRGIVGSAGRRLAIINNETMEVGEESAVRTAAGRVRVKCLEIDPDSVLVQIEGESQPKKLVMEQKK